MKQLSFQTLATFTAGLALLLAAAWLFAPQFYIAFWQVPYSEPVGVGMRRGGALFFTVACVLFLARNAPVSPARTAIAAGVALGALALALQAAFELLAGYARGPAVVVAIVVEVVLAAAFAAAAHNDSRQRAR